MARPPAFFLRLSLLAALAAGAAFLAPGSAYAQMVGGAGGFQSAPGGAPATTVPTRPSSAYSNPYTNNGVAPGGSQVDPYAAAGQSVTPYGMYVAPLGSPPSTMPVAGAQTQAATPGAYGAEGQPDAPPRYSIESAPTSGPYAAQPGVASQYAQPQYAPQYAPPPQYAQPQYAPAPQPQYAPAPQPQYAQPQYAPPPQYAQPQQQYAPQAQPVASQAMLPANNQISSPYAAARQAAMPTQGGQQTEGGYTLGPGDKVRVTIFGEADLSGEYQLDGNGNIRLPLAGVVRAGGYTQQGLEAALYAALVPNYLRNPRIGVEITAYRPIYVVGQVQKPGQYAYVNDMSMLNAIGLAGGFTSQARESSVYVRHEGMAQEEEIATAHPLLIRPGDTIRVDTTLFWDAMNMFAPLSGPAYLATAVH